MQVWEQIISVVISNGVFAILFVLLFFYQLKDSRKREGKYQKTIEDLTVHLDLIEDVREDVQELKNVVKENIQIEKKTSSKNEEEK